MSALRAAAQRVMDSHRQGYWSAAEFDALEIALASDPVAVPEVRPITFDRCPHCGDPVTVQMPTDWQGAVDAGASIPILGCGNPWHHIAALAPDPVAVPEVRPSVTWKGADRTAIVLMAPIVDGLCSGCGTKPSRETGSCRCLFRVDDAIRPDREYAALSESRS